MFDGRSLNGTPSKLFGDFFVFEQALPNGSFVAVGDVNGDGMGDLIAGGGLGGGPRVFILSGADQLAGKAVGSQVLANFFSGNVDYRGGVRVAAKNLDGDAKADLVVGDGTGSGSRVAAYSGASLTSGNTPPLLSFDAFGNFSGGVFVG